MLNCNKQLELTCVAQITLSAWEAHKDGQNTAALNCLPQNKSSHGTCVAACEFSQLWLLLTIGEYFRIDFYYKL